MFIFRSSFFTYHLQIQSIGGKVSSLFKMIPTLAVAVGAQWHAAGSPSLQQTLTQACTAQPACATVRVVLRREPAHKTLVLAALVRPKVCASTKDLDALHEQLAQALRAAVADRWLLRSVAQNVELELAHD